MCYYIWSSSIEHIKSIIKKHNKKKNIHTQDNIYMYSIRSIHICSLFFSISTPHMAHKWGASYVVKNQPPTTHTSLFPFILSFILSFFVNALYGIFLRFFLHFFLLLLLLFVKNFPHFSKLQRKSKGKFVVGSEMGKFFILTSGATPTHSYEWVVAGGGRGGCENFPHFFLRKTNCNFPYNFFLFPSLFLSFLAFGGNCCGPEKQNKKGMLEGGAF